jgi:hypothetical protein
LTRIEPDMWVAILADSVAALEFPVLLGSLMDIKEVARLRIETATLAIDHGEALSQIALQPGSVMAKGNGGKLEARAFDGRRVVLTVLAVDDPARYAVPGTALLPTTTTAGPFVAFMAAVVLPFHLPRLVRERRASRAERERLLESIPRPEAIHLDEGF